MKFKLVVEAHAVLSDPQRRQRYDLGEDEDGLNDGGGGGMGGGFNHMDLSEIFAQFQGGGMGGGGYGGVTGQYGANSYGAAGGYGGYGK